MPGKIIDGKAVAARLREEVAGEVGQFIEEYGRRPGLAVVLVGDDPASLVYVSNKARLTVEVGMESFEYRLPENVVQNELLTLIEDLNADARIDGILVQMPLPAHLDERTVIEAIHPGKDVDGFHIINRGRLVTGLPCPLPCTPLGCMMLLKAELGNLSGLEAVVIGRSNIVGKPMSQLLLSENCTVTVAHSKTRDLASVVRRGDIVVAAIGLPEMIRGSWLKPGAVVIDVGINRIAVDATGRTRLVGDVATKEALRHVRAITPVPGGVGPMTIAVLLRNTLGAAKLAAGGDGDTQRVDARTGAIPATASY